MRRGILVVSASMGAGHDGAARELRRRLVARGHEVVVVDYLGLIPFKLGGFVRWSYQFQLRVLPWSYDLAYRALGVAAPVLWGPVVRLMSLCTRRALRRELLAVRPDAIVSTYPLASLVLGRMRKKGWLRVPVATYLTDFAVHPLWVHPGVDLHLGVSPESAAMAARRGGRGSVASGPLVTQPFHARRSGAREETRARLGIGEDERAVLVVAGSWGVGDVPATIAAIARAGHYHVIAVCGRDEKLRATLVASGLEGTVLGWTDEMPALMAAADVLVENAGGLTAMEAFAAGVPVVTFRPIAGHGKENARTMALSGVSRYARDETDLGAALREATTPGPARADLVAAGRALFTADPARRVERLAATTRSDALLVPYRTPKARRRVSIAVGGIAALYLALTVGAQAVAGLGVGVAQAPPQATRAVFVGVRADRADLRNPQVLAAVRRWHVTLVVDAPTARRTRRLLAALAADRVDIANGGWGHTHWMRWRRAHDDCVRSAAAIADEVGVRVREFVPARGVDAFDQFYCRVGRRRERLVEPTAVLVPGRPARLRGGGIYVLNGCRQRPGAVAAALQLIAAEAGRSKLRVRSFVTLR